MNNRTERDRQATTRLALIAIPLLGSIVFALSSLFGKLLGNDTWQMLMQVASGFMGALGLLAGSVTLVFQMTRREVNLRNVIVFGCLYMLAIFVFLGSCVALPEWNLGWMGPNGEVSQTPTLGPPTDVAIQVDMSPRPCDAPEIPISKKWKGILESANFTKCVMPFGVLIGADYRVPDSYITQAAMVVAEILDPDMDGIANDPRVWSFVREYEDSWLPMPADYEPWHGYLEEELGSKLGSYGLIIPKWWMVGEGEFSDSGPDEHARRVMVEEIIHFMTQFGYGRAYPHVFGVEDWDSVIAKETKRASCDWWQHPENDCPGSPGYFYGDCSEPSCDVAEFYQQVVTTRAGMEPAWRGIGFPETTEDLEAKLSDEMKAAMDEPKYNQISKPLTFSYSVNTPHPTYTPYPTYTPVSPMPTPVHLTETYRNEMSGFSVDYPVNWEVMEWTEESTTIVEFAHPLGSFVRVEIEYLPNEALEDFVASRLSSEDNFRQDSRIKIESLPGYLSEGIGSDSQTPISILMTTNDPWAISAMFASARDLGELDQPIFQAMIESFQIFPPTTTKK